jgi:hypothetical protein
VRPARRGAVLVEAVAEPEKRIGLDGKLRNGDRNGEEFAGGGSFRPRAIAGDPLPMFADIIWPTVDRALPSRGRPLHAQGIGTGGHNCAALLDL